MEETKIIENQKQQDNDNIRLDLRVSQKPNVKTKFAVKIIKPDETYSWLLKKHYAHRLPPISYAFGLYDNDLQGVCTFGDCGGNPQLLKLFENYTVNELNRLVINENLPPNVLSFFVANCLKMMPKPMAIISYADPNNGHSGYIYQATNWLYTGVGSDTIVCEKNGYEYHQKTVFDKLGTNKKDVMEANGYKIIKHKGKHRYFYFLGNKKAIIEMKQVIKEKFGEYKYPKGTNQRYDASYVPNTQQTLF